MTEQSQPATRLVVDVGGTNTRMALFDPVTDELRALGCYTNRDHGSLEEVMAMWLDTLTEPAPRSCCIAVAAPPAGDLVSMVNMDWSFSCKALAGKFGFSRLGCINDFQANAHALPHLAPGDRELLHAGREVEDGILATVGPGTGLGGSTLQWVQGRAHARAGEPGHMGLSPATDLELEIFRLLLPRHGQIHAELLVSGPGLQRLHQVLGEIQGLAADALTPAEISSRALKGEDKRCVLALQTFCALLGSTCGDFVLANGAYAGLYLAGGIVPRMIPFLRSSTFAQRFRDKGAMASRLEEVPLCAITAAQPGLTGAAYAPL